MNETRKINISVFRTNSCCGNIVYGTVTYHKQLNSKEDADKDIFSPLIFLFYFSRNSFNFGEK